MPKKPKPKYPRARLSPAKDQILVIAITHESVVTHDIRPLLDKLLPLAASREIAMRWEGKVTFYFDGWDNDPRETAEIPEIRAYFMDVTAEFPYWFHFVEKVGDTFWHVLRLLCRGHREQTQPGLIGWQFDDHKELFRQINLQFGYMNGLYDQLGLPEEMNQRVSQEIAQLIECSLQ
ncbi:chlororespiratory reduction 6 domain-containing protein [uncultured Thiodictyon sp.]|uniref:chlororespiratory reduction 6 domain-containing protein n=1 Tax=uncultured Thiodictyon sp. TaxID=1846217 RepID=UPI0025FBECD9|nr:chlororespiratory reduction 6 domain-containing protein [uncultured Thiodictyon sp.]